MWRKAFIEEALRREPPCEGYSGFMIDSDNELVIDALCRYFADSDSFYDTKVTLNEPDLDKGIWLQGNPGSGKTLIMEIFNELLVQRLQGFGFVSCCDVAKDFSIGGYNAILKWGNHSFRHGSSTLDYSKPVTVLFDDMGTEPMALYYGNSVNVMEDVIQDRYRHFVKRGMRTHLTTNLAGKEIRERYGERVSSRARQMFNQIALTGKDRRK